MKHVLSCLLFITSVFAATPHSLAADTAKDTAPIAANTTPVVTSHPPRVRIQTNFGDMIFELDNVKAPKTVANFLSYVEETAYDGTLFHRVIEDFTIQGGVYDANYEVRTPHAPVETESTNGLKNERGTIAMAREIDPDSATNQFFINLANNLSLNHHAPKEGYWGFCVFGKITEGLDVLDRIEALPTGAGGPLEKNVPQTQVLIKAITLEPPAPATITAKAEPIPVKETKPASKKNAAPTSKKNVTTKTQPAPQ
jgi:peptidyl-prolyl cis-trans isomerase B (cyclophilin B)